MVNKLSKEQFAQIVLYSSRITGILTEAYLQPDRTSKVWESDFDTFVPESVGEDFPFKQTHPPLDLYAESECYRKNQAMNLLCGRWSAGSNKCGVEISRVGEHFILTYLKRNGYPSDERYILIWLDGDILYYGHEDRITVLALNTENDTLMISPGLNYTREVEQKK